MTGKRLIDLTLTFDERMDGVSFENTRVLERDGWNARTLHIYGHSGTHMDAPLHFGVNSQTTDDFEPSEFIGHAHILRLPVQEDSYLISVSDLESIKDQISPGDSLLIQTGWSAFVWEERYRKGLPRISEQLAHWIVDKGVKMLGVEPPSVADVNNLDEVTRVHQILMEGGVIIIEGLTNIDKIQGETCTLFAFPLKIKDGDGAPARVIAIEDE
ncbi:cyclase family protein [Halalkalibaculum sp. DA384]|uniref:cyclase family protein n=1 Tax=Halalkalibaculum sp. DA384 TaxID=3373606 RepID=UPI003754BBB7